MPPTIVRDGKFRLFFFSREEERIHVHVAHPDGEAKFWLTPEVDLAVNIGLSLTQVRQAQAVVMAHLPEIEVPGVATLEVEVTNVSAHGFWVLVGTEELAVPYAQFPWFKAATVEQITTVERPTENHLYWPRLDVDLSVESLRMPGAFPLVSTGAV